MNRRIGRRHVGARAGGRGKPDVPNGESYWQQYRMQIIGAVIATIVATIGAMMSPLRTPLLRSVYGESVEITIQTSTAQVRPDESFSLKAIARPTSLIGAADGQVTLSFDSKLIQYIGDGSALFHRVPPLEGTTELYDEPLWFRAVGGEGDALITVELTTSYGNTYRGSSHVRIANPSTRDLRRPTRENFVGEWVMQLGDQHGQMTLTNQSQEGHGQIKGIYTFSSEPGSAKVSGKISGTKDGETFTARLTPDTGGTAATEIVNANFCLDNNGYVQIRGRASDASHVCKDFSAWAQAEYGVPNCVAGKWWRECE